MIDARDPCPFFPSSNGTTASFAQRIVVSADPHGETFACPDRPRAAAPWRPPALAVPRGPAFRLDAAVAEPLQPLLRLSRAESASASEDIAHRERG